MRYRDTGKAFAAYAAGALILAFYGVHVCPFLESIQFPAVLGVLSVFFTAGFAARCLILGPAAVDSPGLRGNPWRRLAADLGIWMGIGLLATAWDMVHYHFPFGSGMKIVVGCLSMGILAATRLALEQEHALISELGGRAGAGTPDPSRFVSISTKFLIFLGSTLALLSIVILLLVVKNFDYVLRHPAITRLELIRPIAIEIGFVVSFLLVGCGLVARQYARNLNLIFSFIRRAFGDVEQGRFDVQAPIVSHDEFSEVARHTNQMIQGLRERERIKRIFGKYVSPSVADAIIQSERGSELGGREVNAAILFTDIRNYTTLSEGLTPAEVVEFLNFYFSRVVEAIHGAGGVVDKFIGDAAMAVFGIDGAADANDRAVRAALAIRECLAAVNQHLRERDLPQVDNGVGIHFGRVIAGNIGSPERLEYTVIGDAVNTASRLEGQTKHHPGKVLISADTFTMLSAELKTKFAPAGELELKGKARPVAVYGLAQPAKS